MPDRKTTAPSRLALLLGVSAAAFAAGPPAFAQEAFWRGTGNFGDPYSWSGGSVPFRTAYFQDSGVASVTNYHSIGGFTFLAGAYTFAVPGSLDFVGAGIVNRSSQRPTLKLSGGLRFFKSSSAGNAAITNTGGSLSFFEDSTAGSATIWNYGDLRFYHRSTAGSAAIESARLSFYNSSTAGNATITNYGDLGFYDNSTAGTARLITTRSGTTTFLGTGSLGDGQVSAGSIEGAGAYQLGSLHLTVGGNGRSTEVSGVISGVGGALTKAGAGTLTLSGRNTYTGATTVTGGSLIVNGSIRASSGVTVAAGASLGGSGELPSLMFNGTLEPGNSPGTLTINGNLALGAGSLYLAEVQGPLADRVTVTGTASLAGTLRLVPLGGSYSFNSAYTLLSAAGGLGGTRFNPVDTTGTFGDGVTTAVRYTGNDVLLTLTPKPLLQIMTASPGVSAPRNTASVGSAIDGAVASGADPSALFGIYNLPAASIPAAVNSLSGEVHTAAPAMAHAASDQFLRMMLDGAGAGRLAGTAGGPAGATSFTADLPSKQDEPGRATFDPARFTLWGATFGSTGRTDGDRAVGSANRNLSDGHVAVGADIRLGSNTVAGVAVAGGQSRASLSRGLGKAQADVFQAGLYGRTTLGAVNLAGALGYARLDTDTSRAIPALGRTGVAASYATQAWSGRIEASLPVATWHGLTLSPLAAFQAVRASSPSAIERDGSGATAGMLTLAGRSGITSRSELGLQLDASLVAGATPVTGFVRAAWAHYYQRDADIAASLNGLAGASFAVTGARPDRNAALLAAGADIRLSPTVSLGVRVDAELSENTSRIGGTAQLRVSF